MAITILPEMKFLVILILAAEPIILPFNNSLTCSQQGQAYIEKISTYYYKSLTKDQGWYTTKGKLVYGFYCDI